MEDAVQVLKVVNYFGIWTDLHENLLQVITKHINKLKIVDLTFLNFIHGKKSHASIHEAALKIALPVVFEALVLSHLNRNNTAEVCSAVCFTFEQNLLTDEERSKNAQMI